MYSEPGTAPRPPRRINAAVLALALLSVMAALPLLGSCSRRQSAAPTPSQEASEAGSAAAAAAAAAASGGQVAAAPAAAGGAALAAVPPSGANAQQDSKAAGKTPKPRIPRPSIAASLRAFGLGSPSLARLPEDYSIGPLQGFRVAGEAVEAPLAVADAFMKALASGKLDPKLLAPYSRSALALLLSPEGPASSGEGGLPYRIGAIELAGDSAYLRVRLASSPGEGRVEGSLALGKFDEAWYVEGLSLDAPPRNQAQTSAEGGSPRPVFDPARRASR